LVTSLKQKAVVAIVHDNNKSVVVVVVPGGLLQKIYFSRILLFKKFFQNLLIREKHPLASTHCKNKNILYNFLE
jgi:hypothetical protein